MLRILGLILTFYLICLVILDTVWYGGRYSRMMLQEANYQAYRVTVEVRYQLDKIGIWTNEASFTVPSRADESRRKYAPASR